MQFQRLGVVLCQKSADGECEGHPQAPRLLIE